MKKFLIMLVLSFFSASIHAKIDEQSYENLIAQLAASEMPPLIFESTKYPDFISNKQAELFALTEDIAKKDGHQPRLLIGLLMQETHAGANPRYLKSPGGNHGVGQIRVVAAKHVLKNYPELMSQFDVSPKDEKTLIKKLVYDNRFNVSVMSKYLLILQQYGFKTFKQLALAYNQGPGGAKKQNPETFHYVKGVMKHIKELFP